ncbi:hypothetical protein L4X63_13445 [Geomonas sp. Red32]|uniref:selenite/tellurite reduction operon rhodanese-like protein ExtH n=1 Tax=Geomonas sp. Red32 TaxID=2912856 RepID=UPI00202CC0FB|nr:selenite/tellurite reduction operon rhodanese-like protein ExtH [Geomonas sp. Red32]MCM0082599.1 hypothetical protein [Geomonas sp. Red32]
MSEKLILKGRSALAGLLATVAVLFMVSAGCGTKGYDAPSRPVSATAQTANALVEAATLQQWASQGLVNSQDPNTLDKVVVLEVTTPAAYATAHIPGALLLDSTNNVDLTQTRLEGVAAISTQVPDGTTMDNIIQRSGIDNRTTIVFSVSKGGNFLNMTRAYFTFRYWGFPKERLKVVNGGDNAWEDAGLTLATDATTVAPSTYSVRNTGLKASLRLAIGDMIKAVDDLNKGTVTASDLAIIDARGGTITANVANAIVDDYNRYADFPGGVTTKTRMFPAAADLVTRLEAKGITAARSNNIVYCASGMRASVIFFVLDGVTAWPAKLYDGSWNQWSAYVYNSTTPANNLPTGSIWRVDAVTPGTTALRTTGTITPAAMALDPVSHALFSAVTDPRADQILLQDSQYVTTGATSGTGTSTGTSGGSGTGSAGGC